MTSLALYYDASPEGMTMPEEIGLRLVRGRCNRCGDEFCTLGWAAHFDWDERHRQSCSEAHQGPGGRPLD